MKSLVIHARLRRIAATASMASLLALILTLGDTPKPVVAAPATAPTLALVPADAVGFVHVHLADVWKSEMLATFRQAFEKAGAKALAALDQQLDPPPSAFEAITVFATMTDRGPLPYAIVTFNRAVSPDAIVKHYFPQATAKMVSGKTVYSNRNEAITFPSDRQMMFSMGPALEQYLARPVPTEGPMRAAIDLAATRPVVAAGNLAALPLPADLFRDIPPQIVPLLKAQTVTLSLELQGDPKLHLAATYKDEAARVEAEKALEAAKTLAKEQTAKGRAELEKKLYDPQAKQPRPADEYFEVVGAVMGIGGLNRLDEIIDNPGIRKEGNSLAISVTLPKEMAGVIGLTGATAAGLLLPAVQKVRAAAAQTQSFNNMRQIMIALHNYVDANGRFPTDIKDKNGKPLLSWRVAILPFIEQGPLYQQFKLDEPWDSPANKRASQTVVPTFVSLNAPPRPQNPMAWGLTNYVGVAGPGTAFGSEKGLRFQDVTDGSSNTIFLIETADAVPWAKPGDFVFDPTKPVPNFLFPGVPIFGVAMGDGSVRAINPKAVSEKTLKAAFTINGGEVLGADFSR